MKQDPKTIYAQSSDIKSRTYLEYRKDMKKKAIAELEVVEWLEKRLKKICKTKQVKVYKSGGDKFLWFLRTGGITREPDFIAEVGGNKIEIEFQYAEKEDLKFYDFKVSKVVKGKGKSKNPIKNKIFSYIHKPLVKYAFFEPEWIKKNGEYGMVEAWRSYAFRIPKEKFEKILKGDRSLKKIIQIIDAKNYILNFQHSLIDIYKNRLKYLLQRVVDENEVVKIIPKDLDSFFKVCFILDNLGKIPDNANLWLVYILSYVDNKRTLEEVSKIVYCIDFLYSKIDPKNDGLKPNELSLLISKVNDLLEYIKGKYQEDGSYRSSLTESPLDETRYALFSINLLEDIIQDIIHYYSVKEEMKQEIENLKPIRKIYQNIGDVNKTYEFIKRVEDENSEKYRA